MTKDNARPPCLYREGLTGLKDRLELEQNGESHQQGSRCYTGAPVATRVNAEIASANRPGIQKGTGSL